MRIESEGLPKQIVRKFQIGDMIPPMPTMLELLDSLQPEPRPICVEPGCTSARAYSKGGHQYERCKPHQDAYWAAETARRKGKAPPLNMKRKAGLCKEEGCNEARSVSESGRIYPRCKKHQAEWKKMAKAGL